MTDYNEFDETAENEVLSDVRLEICRACEHLTKRPLGIERCKVCHCILKVKTLFKSQHCPEGKW